VRDPRDVVISLAHFSGIPIDGAIDQLKRPLTTHVAPRRRLDDQLPYHLRTWSEHVVGWLDAPGRSCCLLRYEDMLRSPEQTLMRAAEYCGLSATAAAIAEAVRQTRFEVLAAQESLHGFHGASGAPAPFFRRGQAGEWRDVLNAGQIARLEHDHGSVMQRLGYL
jgi:aryl sulfotransferase